jgi:hemoglobin-like flavoprotein
MNQTELPLGGDPFSALRRQVLRMTHEDGRALASAFYAELFSRHPRARTYFVGLDVEDQAAKLWSVLRLVIARHSERALMAETTRRVGRAHEGRRVGADEYAVFIDTLADVLAHSQRALAPGEAKRLWMSELSALKDMIAGTDRKSVV